MLERFTVFKSLHSFHIGVVFNLSKLSIFHQNIWVLFMSFIQYFENIFFLSGTPCFLLPLFTEKREIISTETNNSELPITKIYTDQSHEKLQFL